MKINSVAIEGFRTFAKPITFDFRGPGLYLLRGVNKRNPKLGANGVGKSTVAEALPWCFYGKTSRGLKAGSIASWRKSKPPKVAVCTDIGTVQRTWNPNTLTLDGNPIEPEYLTNYLPEYDAFLGLVLVSQFGSSFFDLSPTEKLSRFSDLLNLDLWMRASKRAKEEVGRLVRARGDDDRSLALAQGALPILRGEISRIKDRLAKQSEKEAEELENLKQEIGHRKKDLKHCKEVTRAVKRDIRRRDGLIASAEKELAPLVEERSVLSSDISTLSQIFWPATEKAEEAAKAIKQVLKLSGNCPTCYQAITTEGTENATKILERVRADFAAEAEEAKKASDKLDKKFAKVTACVLQIKDKITDLSTANSRSEKQLWTQQTTEGRIREDLASLEKRVTEIKDGAKQVKQELTDARATLAKTKRSIAELREDLDRQDKAISLAELWQKEFKEIRLWLVMSALAELEAYTNSALLALGLEGWKIRFDIEKQNASGTISKGFSVFISSPESAKRGGEMVRWETWSGGETQRLRIASSVGMATLLSARTGLGCNLEIWDEPTAHLSPEGIESLLSFLKDRAATHGKTIWIIDHHSLDAGAFDGEATVIRDRKGVRVESGTI